MIEPQILYGVTCDRCGDTLINSNDNSAWYDRSTAEEEASERALDKQVEEVADLKYRLSSLTQWRDIQADPKWGFATDDAIDEIFRNLPRLVRDKRDGSIELIDYDNAAEWRGDLERKPSLYQWLPINGNTL